MKNSNCNLINLQINFLKSFITILCFGLGFSLYVNGQNPSGVFEGKIIVGNDLSAPEEGAIRFDTINKTFEGYNGTQWVLLSSANGNSLCSCPYVVNPFTDTISTEFEFVTNSRLKFTLEFSHKMDISSFIYSTNVIIAGSKGTSASGTFNWSIHGTKLEIETDESWFTLIDCGTQFSLTLIGSGGNPILGANANILDGDRDGCCAGDYTITFHMFC